MNQFWSKLVGFVVGVLTGQGGSISITVPVQLPDFSISDKHVDIFGKPWTVTLAGSGNALTLSATPQS